MQTFTMQFPVTSTVTIGDGGVITITPFGYVSTTNVDVCSVNATPMSPPAEPVQAVASFQQPPNVRVHGGVGGTMGSQQGPVTETPLFMGSLNTPTSDVSVVKPVVVTKPTDPSLPVDLLLEYISENKQSNVSVELSANELRYKFGRGFGILEDVMVITRDGVMAWSPTSAESPSSKRIAVIYRDRVEGVTHVAPYSNVLRSNVKYLADALRGGNYSIKTLSKILQTTGRHTGCPSHCSVPKHLTEDIKYTPLRDYITPLDIVDIDSTTYSPMTIKTVVGKKYDGVEGLSILTSKGVCPWMEVTPKDVTRIALMYPCVATKTLYVTHYSAATKGQYNDCVGDINDVIQSAAT